MLQCLSVKNGKIEQSADGVLRIDVYIRPDEGERRHLIENLGVDEHTLISSTDPDETPRIEFESNHTAIILKYPKNYSAEDNFFFRVRSMGIFFFPQDRIVVVMDDHFPLFSGKQGAGIKNLQDVLLRILSQTIRHFEAHLRIINMCSEELEHTLGKAAETKNLLDMFTLGKGLVYYLNALSGNGRLIERMKAAGSRMGFSAENLESLDDQAIENHQFLDQAKVYSQVLSDLMDVRASVINNNLNVMMKNMNAIVIAVSVPTFFTGIGGMSEFSAIVGSRLQWYISYPLFFGLMGLLALGIYYLIQRYYSA